MIIEIIAIEYHHLDVNEYEVIIFELGCFKRRYNKVYCYLSVQRLVNIDGLIDVLQNL